ncbi:MAG: D-aminoacylase [Planctomycetes bacterium]|nr:D-aminoacylase [Planctomycetota bacterium]
MAWSLLIRGGTVIDGSNTPGVIADVGVEGDCIAAVGQNLQGDAERLIDAAGLAVAPGFIDMHAHSDLVYHKCPSAESKVRQGVTTEVVGMCSFSPAPVVPGREKAVHDWAAGLGADLDICWETFRQYLDHLRRLGVALNVAHFVGHGALRLAAVGADKRAATDVEIECMAGLLDEALAAGAFGLSTGLVYPPSEYGSTEELIGLSRRMAGRGGIYCSHIRGEAHTLLEAIAEAIQIGEEAGVPVQISHVKASGRENWDKLDRVLAMIDEARSRGLDVTGDVYPYAAGSTKMDNLLPGWMHDGGIEKCLARLREPEMRRRVLAECFLKDGRWGGHGGTVGWDEIAIASCSRRDLEGMNLADLARQTGKSPPEAMMELVLAERAGVSMVTFTQSPDNVKKVLAHPHVMVGSDSITLTAGPGPFSGRPHPRTYGTFPRVLGTYCRDMKLFPLETAVHKMTGLSAAKLGFENRGLICRGFAADLTIFDPANVNDEATFSDPHRHPRGIPYVIINGNVVVDEGRMIAIPAGQVLTPKSN